MSNTASNNCHHALVYLRSLHKDYIQYLHFLCVTITGELSYALLSL